MLYKYPIYPLSDGYGIHLEVVKPAQGIVKMASEISNEASTYVKTLQPDNNIVYILTNALGASEFYGPNKNLDYTPESELSGGGNEYGYMTFSNAFVYRDHLNKDPKYKVGDVLRAFYNPRMHRTELLLAVYKHKAPDIVLRLEQMEQSNDLVGVSYGLKCIFSGNLVLKSDMSYAPIETIKVGDKVKTHLNNSCEVFNTLSRQVNKKVYIKSKGVPQVTCTEEHPFYAIKRENIDRGFGTKVYRKLLKNYNFEWIEASDLRFGDYLVTPIDHTVRNVWTDKAILRSYIRLLGYYLAEGSIIYGQVGNSRLKNRKPDHSKISGISLAFHSSETEYINEVIQLCEELGTENPPSLHEGKDNCTRINIRDRRLASWCLVDSGKNSHDKKLSEPIFYFPKELQKEFLGAYLNGDGYQDKTGRITIQTASKVLAHQLVHLGYRLGILFSICEVEWKKNGKSTVGYMLQCGANSANILANYSSKLIHKEVNVQNGSGRFITEDGNYVLTKITNIETKVETDTVYNLQVEQDESFVVNTLATHNCPSEVCSICGNRNTTRPTRCVHLKYELGKVYPNGSKTMAITEKPIFYDISFVWNRANLEAIVMTKLASVAAVDEQTKNSAVDKIVETNPSVLEVYRNLSDKVVTKLIQNEPDISPEEIAALGEVPLKQILASLSVLGIMLSPEELIAVLKRKPKEITDLGKFSWVDANPKVYDIMVNKVAARSFYRPFILDRLMYKQAEGETVLSPPLTTPPVGLGAAIKREIFDTPVSAPLPEEAGIKGLFFKAAPAEARVYAVYRNRLLNLFNPANFKIMPTLGMLLAMGFGIHYFRKTLDAGSRPLEKFPRFIEAGSVNPISTGDVHQAALSGIMIPSQPVQFTSQYRELVSGIPAAYILGKGIDALDISEKELQNLDKNSNASYGKIYDTEEAAKTDLKIIETLYSGGYTK